jgi:hypothetical protein
VRSGTGGRNIALSTLPFNTHGGGKRAEPDKSCGAKISANGPSGTPGLAESWIASGARILAYSLPIPFGVALVDSLFESLHGGTEIRAEAAKAFSA